MEEKQTTEEEDKFTIEEDILYLKNRMAYVLQVLRERNKGAISS